MISLWLYIGTGSANEADAARALAREGAIWVPGNLVDREAPGPNPGDLVLFFWREHREDPTGLLLGAGRLAASQKPWGGIAWLESVAAKDPLYARARRLGYGGPRNYMTMARLDAWEVDVAGLRRLLEKSGPAMRLEPGRGYTGLPPGKFLARGDTVLLKPAESSEDPLMGRIIVDPAVLQGKPILRGLRISVEQVLGWLAAGSTTDEILTEFPELEREDIQACLEYARRLVGNEGFYPAVKSS